jgi:GT2 family glycosyltransferase/glycosyltransferase involved in cell wall biosynthesis
MRIVYLSPPLIVAGGIRIILEHARRLQERGHEVFIVTTGEPQCDWLRIKVPIKRLNQLAKYARKADAVVATAWFTAHYLNQLFISASKKFYLVQGYEKIFFNDLQSWRKIEETYTMPFNFIAVSTWLQEILQAYGTSSALIPNGVDTKVFYPDPNPYPRPKDKIRIFVEGDPRQPWKGAQIALEAVRGLPVETWTVFPGSSDAGSDKHFDSVSQEEMRQIYSSCDITLKASWLEGFGLGCAEAMACGSVVVTTDSGGNRDFCLDGVNSLVVPPADIWSIREAITCLIKDKKLRKKLRQGGFKTAQEKFNWDDKIKLLEKVYSGKKLVSLNNHPINEKKPPPLGAVFSPLPGPRKLNKPKASIIIPVFNQLPYTKLCLEKIFQYTPSHLYELIIVDNGSTDGTDRYLASLPNLNVIHNRENVGVGKAWNQGIRAAKASYVAVINNDTVVSHHWLENLIAGFTVNKKLGVICPHFTTQQIAPDFDSKAYQYSQKPLSISYERLPNAFHLLVGFFFLAKKEIFEKIGMFDEQFEICLYEDADFQQRILKAGYKIGIINNVLIHHFGQRTVYTLPNWYKFEVENRKRYIKKWGRDNLLP